MDPELLKKAINMIEEVSTCHMTIHEVATLIKSINGETKLKELSFSSLSEIEPHAIAKAVCKMEKVYLPGSRF